MANGRPGAAGRHVTGSVVLQPALAQGSNLWPLAAIDLAPLGLAYLLVVWALRAVAARGASRHRRLTARGRRA